MIKIIEYKGVNKYYKDQLFIKDLNFVIPDGQFISIVGEAGCGKTTILKMINKLTKIDSGQILFQDKDINNYDENDLRRSIGYIIQDIGLFPNMTISENIQVVLNLLEWDNEKKIERVEHLMNIIDMPYERYKDLYPKDLTRTQRQRVAILRGLAGDPNLILMDDPFHSFDSVTKEELYSVIKNYQIEKEKTIVLATKDMKEAFRLSDLVFFVDEGELIQVGTPDEILENPINDTVKNFLGLNIDDQEKSTDLLSSDVMNLGVKIAHKDISIREAVWRIREESIDSLVLVDELGVYQGVIEIDEILKNGKSHMQSSELMEQSHPVVRETDDAKLAFQGVMESGKFAIVLSDEDKPVGIITRTGLTKSMADFIWGSESHE